MWSALEELPGLAAPLIEWHEKLGPDFSRFQRFLSPTDCLAAKVDCPSPGGDGCPRRVVDHGNGEIVAVCGDIPRRCDPIKLSRPDIVIHRVNENTLGGEVGRSLGLSSPAGADTGQEGLLHVGDYQPIAGMRFPVYLVVQADAEAIRSLVVRLCGASDKPFVLLSPTDASIDVDTAERMNRHRARYAALADILSSDGKGDLTANDAGRTMLAEFRTTAMPTTDEDSSVRFPTPADATWGDVVIQFIDGHTVSVRCKTTSGVFNYTQMGMVDRRNGNPDVQWQLLSELAEGRGQMTWEASAARRENKKRKQTLNQRLGTFFGIADEAIIWDKDAANYRCRFQLFSD